MSIELKTLLKKMLICDMWIGSAMFFLITILFKIDLSFIFIVGFITAVLNFIVSGVILEKGINSSRKLSRIMLPLSYVIRIILIIVIALPFIHEFKYLITFLAGFIMHFPILIFSWFSSQKGSE